MNKQMLPTPRPSIRPSENKKPNTNQQREFSSDVFLPFITPNCACCSALTDSHTTVALTHAPPHQRYHHQKTQSLPIAHYHPNTIQLYPNHTSHTTSAQYPVVPIKPQPMIPSGHQLRRMSSRVTVMPFATTTANVEPTSLPLNTFGTFGSPIWSPVLNGSSHIHDSGKSAGDHVLAGECHVGDNGNGNDHDAIDVAPDLPVSRPPSRLRAAAFYAPENGTGIDRELSALSNMTITSTTTEC